MARAVGADESGPDRGRIHYAGQRGQALSMLRATSVKAASNWHDKPADTVVLEFDDRHRRRMAMTGTRGLEFLLDLPETVALRGGDALVLEDGRLVEVVAAPQALIGLRGVDPRQMLRLAWHLGTRHLPGPTAA